MCMLTCMLINNETDNILLSYERKIKLIKNIWSNNQYMCTLKFRHLRDSNPGR